MNTCRLTFEISGLTDDPSHPVTGIVVHGTVAHPYTQVTARVRTMPVGPPLLEGSALVAYPSSSTPDPAAPANDGAWQVALSVGFLPLPCGLDLFVDVEATAPGAPACADSGQRPILCKTMPGQPDGPGHGGPGGSGGSVDDDDPNGDGGWTWPDPPHIACPRWGRTFTMTLWGGMALLMTGAVLANAGMVAAGLAVVGLAGALYMFWRTWCMPHVCRVLGALIWVLKRTTLLGAVLSLLQQSAVGLCATVIIGAVTGALVADARRRRCPLPDARTPLNQLPMW